MAAGEEGMTSEERVEHRERQRAEQVNLDGLTVDQLAVVQTLVNRGYGVATAKFYAENPDHEDWPKLGTA